jgi:adenylylsulfate kinase
MTEEAHVTWHEHSVSREDRERLNGHQGCVVWFTGLSGSGKSTVANEVDHLLHEIGVHSFVLDGDNIRHGLNAGPKMLVDAYGEDFSQRFGLGFSQQDREENIRRIGAVSQLLCAAGIVTLTAFVSPYRKDRRAVRAMLTERGRPGDFVEVYVKAPLDLCESRDPKGLYKQARAGKISNFTGIDDPYEPPDNPELTLDSSDAPPKQLAEQVIAYLRVTGVIDKST